MSDTEKTNEAVDCSDREVELNTQRILLAIKGLPVNWIYKSHIDDFVRNALGMPIPERTLSVYCEGIRPDVFITNAQFIKLIKDCGVYGYETQTTIHFKNCTNSVLYPYTLKNLMRVTGTEKENDCLDILFKLRISKRRSGKLFGAVRPIVVPYEIPYNDVNDLLEHSVGRYCSIVILKNSKGWLTCTPYYSYLAYDLCKQYIRETKGGC